MTTYNYNTSLRVFEAIKTKAADANQTISAWVRELILNFAHQIMLADRPPQIPLVDGEELLATVRFRISEAEALLFKAVAGKLDANELRWMNFAVENLSAVETAVEARPVRAVVAGRNDPLQVTPFAADEHEAVRAAARKAGITKAAWVRRTLKVVSEWELSQ